MSEHTEEKEDPCWIKNVFIKMFYSSCKLSYSVRKANSGFFNMKTFIEHKGPDLHHDVP